MASRVVEGDRLESEVLIYFRVPDKLIDTIVVGNLATVEAVRNKLSNDGMHSVLFLK